MDGENQRHTIKLRQPEKTFTYDRIWTKDTLLCCAIDGAGGVERFPMWRVVRVETERW